jgi:hypothetical protein
VWLTENKLVPTQIQYLDENGAVIINAVPSDKLVVIKAVPLIMTIINALLQLI